MLVSAVLLTFGSLSPFLLFSNSKGRVRVLNLTDLMVLPLLETKGFGFI